MESLSCTDCGELISLENQHSNIICPRYIYYIQGYPQTWMNETLTMTWIFLVTTNGRLISGVFLAYILKLVFIKIWPGKKIIFTAARSPKCKKIDWINSIQSALKSHILSVTLYVYTVYTTKLIFFNKPR